MKLKWLVCLLVLLPGIAFADDIMDFSAITPARTDQIWLIDDPGGTPVEGRASIATVLGLLEAGDIPDISAAYQAVDAEITALA